MEKCCIDPTAHCSQANHLVIFQWCNLLILCDFYISGCKMIQFHAEGMVTTFPRMPYSLMVKTFPGVQGGWIFSGLWRKTEPRFHVSEHRTLADFCYITEGYQHWLPLINAHIQFSAYWRTLINIKHFFQLAPGSASFNTQTVWLMLRISLT